MKVRTEISHIVSVSLVVPPCLTFYFPSDLYGFHGVRFCHVDVFFLEEQLGEPLEGQGAFLVGHQTGGSQGRARQRRGVQRLVRHDRRRGSGGSRGARSSSSSSARGERTRGRSRSRRSGGSGRGNIRGRSCGCGRLLFVRIRLHDAQQIGFVHHAFRCTKLQRFFV